MLWKNISLKDISLKTVGTLKENEMLEDEKWKQVSTYADLVSARRSTDQHSNGEEVSKF